MTTNNATPTEDHSQQAQEQLERNFHLWREADDPLEIETRAHCLITTVTISDGGPTAWINYHHDEGFAQLITSEPGYGSGPSRFTYLDLSDKQTEELVRLFYLDFESVVSRRRNGVIDWRVE